MMRNPFYIGKVESPDYGVSGQGDFEPLVDQATFYRAQALLDGRVLSPARGSGTIRTSHCADSSVATSVVGRSRAAGQRAETATTRIPLPAPCRAVNVSKPHSKVRSLTNWLCSSQRRATCASSRIESSMSGSSAEPRPTTGRRTSNGGSVPSTRSWTTWTRRSFTRRRSTHDLRPATRQTSRGAHVGEDLPSHRGGDELDVEGILASQNAFCRARQTCGCRRRSTTSSGCRQLFFPEGIAYDGNRFNRTAVTAPLFNYLAPSESADERVVSREGIEPSTSRSRVVFRFVVTPHESLREVARSRCLRGACRPCLRTQAMNRTRLHSMGSDRARSARTAPPKNRNPERSFRYAPR